MNYPPRRPERSVEILPTSFKEFDLSILWIKLSKRCLNDVCKWSLRLVDIALLANTGEVFAMLVDEPESSRFSRDETNIT